MNIISEAVISIIAFFDWRHALHHWKSCGICQGNGGDFPPKPRPTYRKIRAQYN